MSTVNQLNVHAGANAVITDAIERSMTESWYELVLRQLRVAQVALYNDPTPLDADTMKPQQYGEMVGVVNMLVDNPDGSHATKGNRVLAQSKLEVMPDGSIKTTLVGEFGTSTANGTINKARVFGALHGSTVHDNRASLSYENLIRLPIVQSFSAFRGAMEYDYSPYPRPYWQGTGSAAWNMRMSGNAGSTHYSIWEQRYSSSENSKLCIWENPPIDSKLKLLPEISNDEQKSRCKVISVYNPQVNNRTYNNWYGWRSCMCPVTKNLYTFYVATNSQVMTMHTYLASEDYLNPTEQIVDLPDMIFHQSHYTVNAMPNGKIIFTWRMFSQNNTDVRAINFDPATALFDVDTAEDFNTGIDLASSGHWVAYWKDPSTGIRYMFFSNPTIRNDSDNSGNDNACGNVQALGVWADGKGIEGNYSFWAGHLYSMPHSYATTSQGIPSAATAAGGGYSSYSYVTRSYLGYNPGNNSAVPNFSFEHCPDGVLRFYTRYQDQNLTICHDFEPTSPSCCIAEIEVPEIIKTEQDQLRVVIELTLKLN